MYADDLLQSALSLHDLQEMINICEKEFVTLDMKENVKKSTLMRVGNFFEETVVPLVVD